MSATNRKSIRKNYDFYATPLDTVNLLLDNITDILPHFTILEPSAGNGNIITALRNKGYTNIIDAIEIRAEEKNNLQTIANNVYINDFLDDSLILNKYDVIIGNPPFSLAQEFIDKSLKLLKPNGKLIFLLRTSFLESEKRFKWWSDKLPTRLYVLHKRPSFTGKGTDATSYSWFIWDKSDDKQIIKII